MTPQVFKKAVFIISMLIIVTHSGCKKDTCEDCITNQLPFAVAGNNQTIILPGDSAYLDAGASKDPDGIIVAYEWTKISGPNSITIVNPTAAKTWVTDLEEGDYFIELKVTNSLGMYAKDTVIIIVARHGWSRLQNFPGSEFFSYGYISENFLLGVKNDVFAISKQGNVWRYSVEANTWSQVGVFTPKEALPVTFSINGMGYCMGFGHCWQYDPATNQWTQKNNSPAPLSAPLVIGDKAYLRSESNHLFAYEPTTDAYTQQKDPPDFGGPRYLLGYFVIDGHGYYVGANGKCWKYDASLDQWHRRASFAGKDAVLEYPAPAVSFSVNNGGYILEDFNHDAYNMGGSLNLWRYDADLNQWTKTNDNYYGYGYNRVKTVSLDSVAFVGLGNSRDDFDAIDFWRYK